MNILKQLKKPKINIKRKFIIIAILSKWTSTTQKSYFLNNKQYLLKVDSSKNHLITLTPTQIYFKPYPTPESPNPNLQMYNIPNATDLNLSSISSFSCFNQADICVICSLNKCFSVVITSNEMKFLKEFKHQDEKQFFKALIFENTDYFFTIEKTKISAWSLEKETCHRYASTGSLIPITSSDAISIKIAPYTKNLLLAFKKDNFLKVFNTQDLILSKKIDTTLIGPDYVNGICTLDVFGNKPWENKAVMCSLNGFCAYFNYASGFTGGVRFYDGNTNFARVKVFIDSRFYAIGYGSNKIKIYDAEKFGEELLKDVTITGENNFRSILQKDSQDGLYFLTSTSVFSIKIERDLADTSNFCNEGCSETGFCSHYYQKYFCSGCKSGYSSTQSGCKVDNIESSKGGYSVLGGLFLPSDSFILDENAGEGGGCYVETVPEPSSSSTTLDEPSSSTTTENPLPSTNNTDHVIKPLPTEPKEESTNYLIYGIMVGCFLILFIVLGLYLKYRKKPEIVKKMNRDERTKYYESSNDNTKNQININENPFGFSQNAPVVKRISKPEGEFIESTGLRAFKLSVHGKKKKKKMNVKQTPNKIRRPYVQKSEENGKVSIMEDINSFDQEDNFGQPNKVRRKVMSFGSSSNDNENLESSQFSEEEEEKEKEKEKIMDQENKFKADSGSLEELSEFNFENNSEFSEPKFTEEKIEPEIKQNDYDFDDEDFL